MEFDGLRGVGGRKLGVIMMTCDVQCVFSFHFRGFKNCIAMAFEMGISYGEDLEKSKTAIVYF